MNRYIIVILPGILLCQVIGRAQGIKIAAGTTFNPVGGNVELVLANGAGLENTANLGNANLAIKATGNGTTVLKGSGSLSVGQIQVNKTAGQILQLQKDVATAGNVTFTIGNIDLNGNTLSLGDTASLINESETSRITGGIGGAVQVQRTLNSPLAENPGNLGLIITSGANLGSTVIKRSHNTFTNSGGGSSIARSYVVQPANNTGLNAFLRMYYKDAELNSLDESQLDFYSSTTGGAQWTDIGLASRDVTQNFVNINGIQSLSLLTLSTANNPLPLLLKDFAADCQQNRVVLQWRTGSNQSIAFFSMNKSKDGIVWEVVAARIDVSQDADHLYSFTDMERPYSFYRLESVGYDGRVAYAPVRKVDCSESSTSFSLQQNPVNDALMINIQSVLSWEAQLQVFDFQGRLMQTQTIKVAQGQSQFQTSVGQMAAGIYQLRISSLQQVLWQTKFVKR